MAEQGKQAKAEADKLVDKADKQVIYERIDACLTEYDTLVRSFASTMAWFKSGRKAVREMLTDQATVAEQKKAAKVARKQIKLLCPKPVRMRASLSQRQRTARKTPPGRICVRVC